MSAVMKHVYHYCARRESGECITVYDGILYCDDLVVNMPRYTEIKRAIAGDGESTDGLVITSLTPLGRHEVSDLGPTATLLGATT